MNKQMQKEKKLIRLASAGIGGLFYIFVGSINSLDMNEPTLLPIAKIFTSPADSHANSHAPGDFFARFLLGCEDRVAFFAGEDRELLADLGRSSKKKREKEEEEEILERRRF